MGRIKKRNTVPYSFPSALKRPDIPFSFEDIRGYLWL